MLIQTKSLKRMVDAMNDGGRCTNAKGLMLPNANHNLSRVKMMLDVCRCRGRVVEEEVEARGHVF